MLMTSDPPHAQQEEVPVFQTGHETRTKDYQLRTVVP